jgi:OOP family OmpA-OmpF porin
MHDFRTGSKVGLFALVLSSAALVAGCSGTRVFAGQNAFSVVGTPPPPPPPPKKEEPPPPPPKPEPPPRVEVRDNKIEIKEKIQFEYNKAVILPASFSLLDEIADVIKKNPHIKKISIEGHASAEGDPKHNLKLSDDRAKSVQKYLVDKGIDAKSLTAKGFGITKPIADNKTEEGKEKNRRVEFVIVEQDVTKKKVQIDPKTGKEVVLEEKSTTETKKEEPAPTEADAKKKAEADKKKAEADKKKAEEEKKKAEKEEKKAAPKPPAPKAPEAPKAPATP